MAFKLRHLAVVASVLSTMVGGIAWLTTMHSDQVAMGESLKEVKAGQSRYTDTLMDINTRLARIEGELKLLNHHFKRREP